MKPYLLYEEREHTFQLSEHDEQIMQDLHVIPLLNAMSRQDPFIYNTAKQVMLQTLKDEHTILHRQSILSDIILNPSSIKRIYALVTDLHHQSADYRSLMKPNFSRHVRISEKLKAATELLAILLPKLREIRDAGVPIRSSCRSKGLRELFNQLDHRYSEAFLLEAGAHLKLLQHTMRDCRLHIGARIGHGLKGTGFTLRKLEAPQSFLNKFRLGKSDTHQTGYSITEIEESALANVLRIVSRFIDASLSFTELLRFESSFYVGCMHLYDELKMRGCEVVFPFLLPPEARSFSFQGLYDPSLAIHVGRQPVTNDLQANDTLLLVVTGTNQGGKTTFLRSMGLAQLMMQCGMFVPAVSFQAKLYDRIFTHFTRKEDETMRSGKLDEELGRLDHMIDGMTPHSLLLMNEPFASTTERDGSAIARDLLSVCYELQLQVCIVTHFYELASWAHEHLKQAVIIAPVRGLNGLRSYKLTSQQPSPTSYGEDLYRKIIGDR